MSGVTLKATHQLIKLRELRRRRAEDALRARHLALDNATADFDVALTELRAWQQDWPRREDTLYDTLIGETVALKNLEEMKAEIVSLRDHERLLKRRLEETRTKVEQAQQAREEAYNAVREAHWEFNKCNTLLRALQAGSLMEEE
ncbi:type III secretion system stalk subunit SctO (plasmid) [Bradyrhizobium sp. Pa8]|uniref:type III secretion system stalk subunit SctO n=1 Tax=Bradyrhizobium sp. Pa8 TaxID=3386552 RepID=UPI00403F773D